MEPLEDFYYEGSIIGAGRSKTPYLTLPGHIAKLTSQKPGRKVQAIYRFLSDKEAIIRFKIIDGVDNGNKL